MLKDNQKTTRSNWAHKKEKKNGLKAKVRQIAPYLIIRGEMSSCFSLSTSGSQELFLFQMGIQNWVKASA